MESWGACTVDVGPDGEVGVALERTDNVGVGTLYILILLYEVNALNDDGLWTLLHSIVHYAASSVCSGKPVPSWSVS